MNQYITDKRARHAAWFKENTIVLEKADVKFIRKPTAYLFRTPGKPFVDFYPHTGRWRVVGKFSSQEPYRGGARAFLKWYEKQTL